MKWFIKRNILNFKSMLLFVYDLDLFHCDEKLDHVLVNGVKLFTSRLKDISEDYGARLVEAISRMDIKPTFDLKEARGKIA